jgi:hypothetical protein
MGRRKQMDNPRPYESDESEATAEDTLREGMTSQTGRVDVADASMGSGSGTGTFSRLGETGEMRDAPEDSNLRGSEDPTGGTLHPNQTGGEREG